MTNNLSLHILLVVTIGTGAEVFTFMTVWFICYENISIILQCGESIFIVVFDIFFSHLCCINHDACDMNIYEITCYTMTLQ